MIDYFEMSKTPTFDNSETLQSYYVLFLLSQMEQLELVSPIMYYLYYSQMKQHVSPVGWLEWLNAMDYNQEVMGSSPRDQLPLCIIGPHLMSLLGQVVKTTTNKFTPSTILKMRECPKGFIKMCIPSKHMEKHDISIQLTIIAIISLRYARCTLHLGVEVMYSHYICVYKLKCQLEWLNAMDYKQEVMGSRPHPSYLIIGPHLMTSLGQVAKTTIRQFTPSTILEIRGSA